MKKFTTEQVDAIFAEYLPFFDLTMPYVWDKVKIKDIQGFHSIEDFGTDDDYHFIGLNFKLIDDEIHLIETIVHELVHAWQYENGFETEHDADFAAWCAFFEIKENLNIASSDVCAKEIFINHCEIMKGV